MLFYRGGYVFDTDDSSKQKVSVNELHKALSLGIFIHGARLNVNNLVETYDFVKSNSLRLQSLGIYSYDNDSNIITLSGSFGVQVASLICQSGVGVDLYGSGCFIYDSFCRVERLELDSNAYLDLTGLDEVKLIEVSKLIYLVGGLNVSIMLSSLRNKRLRVRPELETKFFECFWLRALKELMLNTSTEAEYEELVALLKRYRGVSEAYFKSTSADRDFSVRTVDISYYEDIVSAYTSKNLHSILQIQQVIISTVLIRGHFLFCLYCLFPDSEYFSSLTERLIKQILDKKCTVEAVSAIKARRC